MVKPEKKRLDRILVERGLVASREQAQRVIRAGQIRRGTDVLDKPGALVAVDADLEYSDLRDRFVGRGGWKLQAAIDAFPGLTPCPAVCADIGASTGGFTDCLLQHGARRVYAIDVGAGQLDARLRADPRVVVMEKTNARYLTAESLPERVDLVVSDVSFISLEKILPAAKALLRDGGELWSAAASEARRRFPHERRSVRHEPGSSATESAVAAPGYGRLRPDESLCRRTPQQEPSEPRDLLPVSIDTPDKARDVENERRGDYCGGQIVVLVKPQFEAGPRHVGKGGVVRDPKVHRDVLRRIVLEVVPAVGLTALGLIPSPIKGPAGNREYLVWISNRPGEIAAVDSPAVDSAAIQRVVAAAFEDVS